MPMNTTGTSFSSFGISCHREGSFRNSFRGKNDEVVKCSIGERTISFSVRKFSRNILDTVNRQSAKDIDGWIKDERIVYPSRVINQEIDNYCFQKNAKISTEERQRVFSLVSQENQLTLDVKAAQSSINHVIMGSASFGKKMDALCDGMSRDVKNRTSDTIANLLADKFYQKHIDSDIDIAKLRNDIPAYLMRAIQG
ncbi:T3SS effector guanine nucleotide exchange factor EspM2 [Escherichia albertii]|uniref:T3SS effector guanine nucleotide exchange factor EspM2 n=1 Tax=Escherichia albertii TaxID=208962 RepID=UPI000C14876C|nr:T3SS effector guanine nucleotide exchange factor EspM2 [Escherichia albertii]EID0336610.1 T3SS effector guanine nucleotide exchange factor EspM2 [Escherichia coli]EFF0785140.1 T3SS effector guanine nucleotide exchange factor EspM2 [Escherichia albertii]MCQ8930935.1 T3SS effector guanine nucleotide exchange factor EspM2 [Escherichia albertii]MCQ8966985.1 T3SS effector guanine nucleotide exchange factor EspM2 [Escherichia albertii]MCZ8672991.1 T3SS effector guanine nucleotide exchange factor 